MKKNYTSFLSLFFVLAVLSFFYGSLMPLWTSSKEDSLSEFSTQRALALVTEISKKPHYVGSENHETVALYLQKELQNLGLKSEIQEGYTLTDWGNLVKSKNVLARIEGTDNSKALLLLSHYDSAPHSFSDGASDDASGIATILEGVRAFLHSKKPHKNDIIILFTDAEELGLNGAALFVTQHAWAKEIGLALNFEARGTSGPSYMLMETTKGNAALVKAFSEAKTCFPVSNSLMYSVYKMLPNDTDLTVFKKQGQIQGYNFAFIDDHYNYHTEQDDVNHLNKNSLTHQGTYLMPLLNYFSNSDLNSMQTTTDYVYFNIPFSFVSYPFDWVLPMTVIAFGLLIILIFIGKGKRILTFNEIGKGFIPLFGSLITAGLTTFLGWKVLMQIYPQYQDLLNGFTYNGHDYIAAFILLSLSICFAFYQFFSESKATLNYYVAPLFLWILLNAFLANSLQGAGFLIIPVYFGLFSFAFYILTQKSIIGLNLFLSIPTLFLIAPFIQMFPIGLGLKVLFGSAVLTVLAFALMLPVFGVFIRKGLWSFFFFIMAIGFFVKADYASGYEAGKAKSNSLLYIYDADTQKANWVTYDTNLDSWTKEYLGQNPKEIIKSNELPLYSKYNSEFTYSAEAPIKAIAKPTIEFLKDSIAGNMRHLKIKIAPNRKVNRYDIFANEKMVLLNFKANGVKNLDQKGTKYLREGKRVMSYYVVDNEPLVLQFMIKANTVFDMDLIESSFDLMTHPLFRMTKRASWMMPTPFVLNDAVTIRQKIKPSENKSEKSTPKTYPFTISKDSLQAVNDTIKTNS
jgi:hypothetical protein